MRRSRRDDSVSIAGSYRRLPSFRLPSNVFVYAHAASSTDQVATPRSWTGQSDEGPFTRLPKEMTLQTPHLARISRTSTFGRTIGPYRLRCRVGARFRSSPNIDNLSFTRCNALPLKCVELQRKAILNEHGHRKVIQRPEGLRLHSARRWRQGRIRPRHCARG